MRRFDFFFDYGSPYSYLADSRLPALAERTGAELRYRPMLLGGVFKATGNSSPVANPCEPKRVYGALELERWIAHLGVPFRFNPHFPINTLLLMRTAVAAQRAGVFQPFHRAVYPSFWAEGENLGEPEVVIRVVEKAGLDARALLEAAGDGSADPFVLRPGIHLFIAHDRDPFPAPHDPSSGEIVRAGSFTLIPFRTGIDSRKLELCVFQKGGEGMWVPFSTESLPFVNSDPDRVRWPGAEVEIRASLVVEIPSPRRIVLYFLTTLGAEVTGMTVNGKPLARTFLFERLGWCLSGYRWEPPLPGRHEVQVSLRSPDDRKAPIYFELFDVRTEPDR